MTIALDRDRYPTAEALALVEVAKHADSADVLDAVKAAWHYAEGASERSERGRRCHRAPTGQRTVLAARHGWLERERIASECFMAQ